MGVNLFNLLYISSIQTHLKSQISNHDFWRHFEKEKDEGLWRTKGAGLEQGLAVEHALGVHIPGYHSVHANAQQPDHTFSTVCTPTRNSQITHLAQCARQRATARSHI